MRAISIVLSAAVAFVAVACGSSGDPATPAATPPPGGASAEVVTKLLSFEPEKITVKAGTTVTWRVSDSIGHTVTTGTFTVGGDGLRSGEQPDGELDMKLARGQDVSFTFDQPGTYTYYCSIHKGMNGEVEVTP